MLMFSGTPEEFQAVAHLFKQPVIAGDSTQAIAATAAVPTRAAPTGAPPAEMYRRIWTYKGQHPNQIEVVKALHASPAAEWIKGIDLASRAGIDPRSLPGVLGGLGSRVTVWLPALARQYTGVRPSRWLVEQDRIDGEDYYRLNENFRAAIDEHKLLES